MWNMKTVGPKDKSPTVLSLKHTLHGHTGPVSCLATSSSYNLIVSGSKVRYIGCNIILMYTDHVG